jgi:hypothetical protein
MFRIHNILEQDLAAFKIVQTVHTDRVRSDIWFEANISEYESNIYLLRSE